MGHPPEKRLSLFRSNPISHQPSIIANHLATALDQEDYASAHALLADSCVYDIGTETLVGPDAIIASYQKNGEEAPRRFDAIEYESAVEATGPSSAVILYTDRVSLGGKWHEYQCRQHVSVNEAGEIVSIRHEEIPGRRERLVAFERENKSGE